jgi:hypothetical protein
MPSTGRSSAESFDSGTRFDGVPLLVLQIHVRRKHDDPVTSIQNKPSPFHKMTERHQRADAVADDLGDREHRC